MYLMLLYFDILKLVNLIRLATLSQSFDYQLAINKRIN
ncbi:hypothetical protein GLIP_1773 [Aliiglaciecola lipolytica E3]|uniref:Uncharacterized protein n=1 Tax=Aliiglaciecola lipolytica E3 TaxID=1127673 RepID=K6Y873_9ALTE|nr:hypothetical protein GLIP_1773 [Aliiglaciecola lipolytica E3]